MTFLFKKITSAVDRLRVRYYEDTQDKADWDRSGGKPVPVVRMVAVKEQAPKTKR